MTVRRAQRYLVENSEESLPILLSRLRTPKRDQDSALIYYLVGEIDSDLYGRLLLQSAQTTGVDYGAISKDLNLDALPKLPSSVLDEIDSAFGRINLADLDQQQQKCIEHVRTVLRTILTKKR